jgi:hypothetical protein
MFRVSATHFRFRGLKMNLGDSSSELVFKIRVFKYTHLGFEFFQRFLNISEHFINKMWFTIYISIFNIT